MIKHFSLKVWLVTSLAMLVGATALWATSRLLKLFFGSCTEGVCWLLAHSGNFKRAFYSICIMAFFVYLVRIIRAVALWLEAKSKQERNLLS